MMVYIPRKLALVAFVPLALAGCGHDNTPAVTPPPPPAASFESKFGTAFAGAFDASNTADPIDPTANSVPAVDPTAAPIDN